MADSHSHHGGSLDHPEITGRNLLISICLNIGITLAQAIGGFISGSLSLLSDALHNFTDVISLMISYIASRFSKKQASFQKTFGYKRAEIIAAFVNASTLMVIAVLLIIEAVQRFFDPQEIQPNVVIWLSILAIAGNGFSVWLLKKDSENNMNMRSAYLHLFTDMLASVAVLIGGLLMKYYQLFWIDSVLTAGIAVYLIIVGFDLLKSSFNVLMLFTPNDIPIEKIVAHVSIISEIKNMHHVHIWQLNEDEVHLEAQVDFHDNISLAEFDLILERIEEIAQREFGINHVNIQPEYNKSDDKEMIVQD